MHTIVARRLDAPSLFARGGDLDLAATWRLRRRWLRSDRLAFDAVCVRSGIALCLVSRVDDWEPAVSSLPLQLLRCRDDGEDVRSGLEESGGALTFTPFVTSVGDSAGYTSLLSGPQTRLLCGLPGEVSPGPALPFLLYRLRSDTPPAVVLVSDVSPGTETDPRPRARLSCLPVVSWPTRDGVITCAAVVDGVEDGQQVGGAATRDHLCSFVVGLESPRPRDESFQVVEISVTRSTGSVFVSDRVRVGPGTVTALACVRSSGSLLVGFRNGDIRGYDRATRRSWPLFHLPSMCCALSVSPSLQACFAASADGVVTTFALCAPAPSRHELGGAAGGEGVRESEVCRAIALVARSRVSTHVQTTSIELVQSRLGIPPVAVVLGTERGPDVRVVCTQERA